jgi:hypothetical protein
VAGCAREAILGGRRKLLPHPYASAIIRENHTRSQRQYGERDGGCDRLAAGRMRWADNDGAAHKGRLKV